MPRTGSVADEALDFPVVTLIGVVDLHARNEIVDVDSTGGRRPRPCAGEGSRRARKEVDR
jgi:hypothetical protein